MKGRTLAALGAVLICAMFAAAQTPIALPAPVTDGGKPLLTCLKARHTTREFAPDSLPLPVLSQLLWSAFGVNREDGHRTAPSAMNWQETEIYAFLPGGIYRYDAKAHQLIPVVSGDHRAAAGVQPFVATAPLNLVYVTDGSKMLSPATNEPLVGEEQALLAGADVGFIAQNVYLFCASENLSCVVRAYVDRDAVSKLLGLPATQRVTLAQTVGYPAR